jgi:lipoate-protein ligase A
MSSQEPVDKIRTHGLYCCMTETWRFLDTGRCPTAHNMALDEAIAIAVKRGEAPPTLRLYGWNKPSVSIGYFQKVADVNIEYCIKKNIPLVRRLTGGRAILHRDEITYSFSSKTTSGLFSKGLLDSYKAISTAIHLALSKMGISSELKLSHSSGGLRFSGLRSKSPLCFQCVSYGEITIKGKKVIGSAQKRWIDALLQQGSIPIVTDGTDAAKVFRLCTQDMENSFVGLRDILPGFMPEEFKEAVRISFEETFNIEFAVSSLSQTEISMARQLEVEKYSSHEWNFKS